MAVTVTPTYPTNKLVKTVSAITRDTRVALNVLVVVSGTVTVRSVERELKLVWVALSSNVDVVVVNVVVALTTIFVVTVADPITVVVRVKVLVDGRKIVSSSVVVTVVMNEVVTVKSAVVVTVVKKASITVDLMSFVGVVVTTVV